MNTRTLDWVNDAMTAQGTGLVENHMRANHTLEWLGAAIDTRMNCVGRIFFALPGEHVDGHEYVRDAIAKGSVAAVVDNRALSAALVTEDVPHYLVENVTRSLQLLSQQYRRRLDARVVAVTGSGGKTTTKEYIAAILGEGHSVHATVGNYNSMIGVPMTVLGTPPDSEYLVCEIGANQMGEVEFLSAVVTPDIAVITNIGDAHIGYFGSRDNIAAAKAELVASLPSEAVAVLPRDDDYFEFLMKATRAEVRTFGCDVASDYGLKDIRTTTSGLAFSISGENISLPAYGNFNASNAAAAYAVGDICGVDKATIRNALAKVSPMRGRGSIHDVNGATIIDESYNASPSSLVESLSTLGRIDAVRRIAVLGDMAELGDYAKEKHELVGRHIASLPIDIVYWVGESAAWVGESMSRHGASARFESMSSASLVATELAGHLSHGDLVLVKASRSCGLDAVIDVLVKGERS